jgi:uncharacterized membrane protein YfcA
MWALLAAAAAGLVAGALSGTFGVGGGVVLVPLLGLVLGLEQHDAQGVTLAVMLLPIGAAAVIAYHRAGAVRWGRGLPLVAGFLVGEGGGSLVATTVPERPLRLLFVAFLLAIAARNWRAGRADAEGLSPRRASRHAAWHAVWIGAAGGVASGLLGIGGAVIMIPLLTALSGLTQHEAQGTSLATMLPPVGLPGVLIYARAQGGLPWAILWVTAAAFLVGGAIGALFAVRTTGSRLVRGFALFQLTVAVLLVWRVVRG